MAMITCRSEGTIGLGQMTPKRRRIVIVAPWYPSRSDPVAGVFIEQQARALARYHDVAVIALDYRGWRKVAKNGFAACHNLSAADFPVVRSLVVGVVPYSYRAQSPLHSAGVRRGLEQLGPSWEAPDLVHAHVIIPAGTAAARVAPELGVPLVVTEHWSDFESLARAGGSGNLIRSTLRRASQVVAVGPILADQVRAVDPTVPLRVIGNAIDTDFYAEVVAPEAPEARPTRLLIIGRLIAAKGLHDLLDAMQIARSGGTETELAIVGDGHLRAELERRATALGLGGVCSFDGPLGRDGVRSRLQWCDALVVASHYETFGVTVAEALATGRPVIATRCGGPEFVMGDACGVLVPVRDPAALAQAIADLAAGRLPFDAEGARASIRERFGLESVVEQLSDVYDAVLG